MDFSLVINPLEGVRGVSIHVAVSIGGSAVAHEDGHLVEGLGGVGPEIPLHVGVLSVGCGVTLLGVDEVGELDGVLYEEHRGIVTDHIVVSFLGIMLEGKATGVTIAIVGSTLTSDGGEAEEDGGLLADLVEELGLAETK